MKVSINKADIIWSYLGTFTALFSNIIIVPLLVYFLDGNMLGLWYVFISIGGIAQLFDFGFTVTFARNITYCWSGASSLKKQGVQKADLDSPDFVLMKRILYTCKIIYFAISLAVFLLLITIGVYYIYSITHDIEGNEHIIAYILFSIGIFFNLYYNYYDSFLRGVGAIKESNKNKVKARLIQLFLMVLFLFLGWGILGLSLTFLIFGFVFRFLSHESFYKYQNIGEKLSQVECKVDRKESSAVFKTIWYNAWREGLIQISQYCNTQFTVLICSSFFTLQETGIYSLGVQIANAVTLLSSVLYGTYQPMLQNSYVNNDYESIRKYMSLIISLFTVSFIIGVLGSICVGIPILRLIKPEVVISIPLLLGIFLNMYILKFRECYTSYFSSTNRLIYMNAFVFASVLSVLLSYVFLRYLAMGIWGIIWAQLVSQLIYNAWKWPYLCFKELHLNVTDTIMYFKDFIYSYSKR